MSMPDWGIVAVPVVAIICFLVGEAVKLTPINKGWIPVICGVVGGILGVVAMKVMPLQLPSMISWAAVLKFMVAPLEWSYVAIHWRLFV